MALTINEHAKTIDALEVASDKLTWLTKAFETCVNSTESELDAICDLTDDVDWLKRTENNLKHRKTLFVMPNVKLNRLWAKYVLETTI